MKISFEKNILNVYFNFKSESVCFNLNFISMYRIFFFFFFFLSFGGGKERKKKVVGRKRTTYRSEQIAEYRRRRGRKARAKWTPRFLWERFRSHQRSLTLIACGKIRSDRAISVVICLVWMRSLSAGMGVGVQSIPTE